LIISNYFCLISDFSLFARPADSLFTTGPKPRRRSHGWPGRLQSFNGG